MGAMNSTCGAGAGGFLVALHQLLLVDYAGQALSSSFSNEMTVVFHSVFDLFLFLYIFSGPFVNLQSLKISISNAILQALNHLVSIAQPGPGPGPGHG